jgi:hypothetical protein
MRKLMEASTILRARFEDIVCAAHETRFHCIRASDVETDEEFVS